MRVRTRTHTQFFASQGVPVNTLTWMWSLHWPFSLSLSLTHTHTQITLTYSNFLSLNLSFQASNPFSLFSFVPILNLMPSLPIPKSYSNARCKRFELFKREKKIIWDQIKTMTSEKVWSFIFSLWSL